jgi:hypothetical protein
VLAGNVTRSKLPHEIAGGCKKKEGRRSYRWKSFRLVSRTDCGKPLSERTAERSQNLKIFSSGVKTAVDKPGFPSKL